MIICRVCLDSNDKLIPLISDREDAWPLVYMLSEFTIVNAEDQLPKYMCEACAAHLDVAYAFKRKYDDSAVRFVRQTSHQGDTEDQTDYGPSQCYGNINSEDQESSLPPIVYKNQETNPSFSNINQQDINNDNGKSNIHPDVFNNRKTDDGMLGSVNTNLCRTQSTEQQEDSRKHLKLKRSHLKLKRSHLNLKRSHMKPPILGKIFHYVYGMKPFKCDVCCSWFKTKSHVKAHLLRHYVGMKRVKCIFGRFFLIECPSH